VGQQELVRYRRKAQGRPRDSCGLKTGRSFGRIIHREGRGVEPVQGEILPAKTLAANPWESEFLD
jgi:hypothetical protein